MRKPPKYLLFYSNEATVKILVLIPVLSQESGKLF